MFMKIIGHRGARNEAPENTVQGFVHAFQNGCQHFELDIQLSADKQLIVYHDKSLRRTSGENLKLNQQNFAFLSRMDSRLNTPGWHSECFISRLEDIYHAVPDTQSWQFEVKTDRRDILNIVSEKLSAFIDCHNLYEKCHVTSTNKWFLKALKFKNPKINTGFVCEYLYQRPIKSCLAIGANLIVLKYSLASHRISRLAKRNKLEVSCWTVNSIEAIDTLLEMGVKSIITDEPTRMLQHYKKLVSD